MFGKQRNVRQMLGLALVVTALLGLLLVTVQSARANTRVEAEGQVPFYARFGANETFHDRQYAVIVFYRPPQCIPSNFNLLQFFHFPSDQGPGAFGCNPPTTDSFEIWENGPGIDPAPIQSVLRGRGAVPIWFVDWQELQAAMDDGYVTIGDLAGLPSLQIGHAGIYQETLQPTQSANNPLTKINARGSLDDGGSFAVHILWSAASGQRNVQIDLDS